MDQPQPVSQVLSVSVHGVMTQILSTCHCHPLSCRHDLESGGLSDTSMDHPCGEGGPMLQSQRRGLVLAPKGTLPPRTHLPAGDRRPHSPGGRGSWRGRGRRMALWVSVDERERGSPRSPSEMSLSQPGPRANLSLRVHTPSPEAQIRNKPE